MFLYYPIPKENALKLPTFYLYPPPYSKEECNVVSIINWQSPILEGEKFIKFMLISPETTLKRVQLITKEILICIASRLTGFHCIK